jgi:hypothetical protein
MSVIGRAWRCETCHRLWVEQKHPGATHDHVDGIVVCRGQVIEVEVVPYPNHAGAVDALVRIATRDYDPLQHESPGSLAREALAAMGVDPATYGAVAR